ncbi:potassium channel [Aureococcus anophagefferens]|nr:potassium channel [Aureococcus anophagefferens]
MLRLIILAAATAYHVKEMHTEKVATTYEPDEEIPCPFQQTDDPSWYLAPAKPGAPGPRGRRKTCAFLGQNRKTRALCGNAGADGRPGSAACPNACDACCDGSPVLRRAHAREAPRGDQAAACCTADNWNRSRPVAAYLTYPRSHVEAAFALAENSDRDVDASFVGRLHRLPEENLPNQRMNRITWENRRWVVAFARTFFTAASVFVDTTVQDPAAYERLGPYDASAGAAASYRPTSSTRDGIDAGDAHRCAKASCDGAYYAALRAGKDFRFFEAILAGAVPVVSHPAHSGRSYAENALGYKYLRASEYAARRERFPGPPPYCAGWAAHNRAIFLAKQTAIADAATVAPGADRCAAEAFS